MLTSVLGHRSPSRCAGASRRVGAAWRVADDRPLLLVLDDLHASDESSLLLLRFVAAELRDAPVVAIGTYRSTEARMT